MNVYQKTQKEEIVEFFKKQNITDFKIFLEDKEINFEDFKDVEGLEDDTLIAMYFQYKKYLNVNSNLKFSFEELYNYSLNFLKSFKILFITERELKDLISNALYLKRNISEKDLFELIISQTSIGVFSNTLSLYNCNLCKETKVAQISLTPKICDSCLVEFLEMFFLGIPEKVYNFKG